MFQDSFELLFFFFFLNPQYPILIFLEMLDFMKNKFLDLTMRLVMLYPPLNLITKWFAQNALMDMESRFSKYHDDRMTMCWEMFFPQCIVRVYCPKSVLRKLTPKIEMVNDHNKLFHHTHDQVALSWNFNSWGMICSRKQKRVNDRKCFQWNQNLNRHDWGELFF